MAQIFFKCFHSKFKILNFFLFYCEQIFQKRKKNAKMHCETFFFYFFFMNETHFLKHHYLPIPFTHEPVPRRSFFLAFSLPLLLPLRIIHPFKEGFSLIFYFYFCVSGLYLFFLFSIMCLILGFLSIFVLLVFFFCDLCN